MLASDLVFFFELQYVDHFCLKSFSARAGGGGEGGDVTLNPPQPPWLRHWTYMKSVIIRQFCQSCYAQSIQARVDSFQSVKTLRYIAYH